MDHTSNTSSSFEDDTPTEYLPSLNRPLAPPSPVPEVSAPHPFTSNMSPSRQPDGSRKRIKSSSGHNAHTEATLGQFSSATQTTVVTTTTTTTTKFPPFVMRAPRRMQELDPKLYPLASSPTPASLKTIRFDFEGKPTVFHEAKGSTVALKQMDEDKETARAPGGSSPSIKPEASASNASQGFMVPQRPSFASFNTRQRPVSPVSLSEGLENVRRTRSTKQRRGVSNGTYHRPAEGTTGSVRGMSRVASLAGTHPATPDTASRSAIRRSSQQVDETDLVRVVVPSLSSTPRLNGQPETPQTLGSRSNLQDMFPTSGGDVEALLVGRQTIVAEAPSSEQSPRLRNVSGGVVPTPPMQENEAMIRQQPQPRRGPSSIPTRLTAFENAQANDVSLPSPSLSPVTAAANMHNAGGYFHAADETEAELDLSFASTTVGQHDDEDSFQDTPSRLATEHERLPKSSLDHSKAPLSPEASPLPLSSINNIPQMLDFFEAIPDELKSYVMHQLLRRCPKSTLHVIADVVNPALKCDFLGNLPLELGLNIVKHLDVKSLCRASQVSKKWRRIISNDQQVWKKLFDEDGFELAEGELFRAIREGWGWQDPSGTSGWEQDLSLPAPSRSDSDRSVSSTPVQWRQALEPSGAAVATSKRRPKRKAAAKLSDRRKQLKRGVTRDGDDSQEVDWMTILARAEGPNHAATAAMVAVPHPSSGLLNLKEMHLYKSLYRRHYLIRKSWMQEEIKPKHIAFRAHDRHVVTCLQFDADKILTGSDDTNINVYDTKTGALRTRLQGHEGGVWALQYEGNVLVSGSTDRSVRVWDIESGRQMQVFHGHTSTVRCLQILMPTEVGKDKDGSPKMMPEQPLIITGSRDSNLRVWRLPHPDDKEYYSAGPPQEDADCSYFVRILAGHQHSVRAIAAHADTLVSGSYDCTVRVWKISTGETVHRLQGHTQKVYSVVLDHARNRCISGSMDNLVKIWSLDTGSVLYTLEGHSSLVGLLDLNCDRLVSAAADSTLRIWDPENGQCKSTLSAHTGAITCFQHDGQKVISGSDRTLKMWNVKNGECVKDLLTDLSGVWQVKFNERRCVAAVQRSNMTYIEVLDFGASRDGVPDEKRGHRIVVDTEGREFNEPVDTLIDLDADPDA